MKNVIILGASGNIARHVIEILVKKNDINISLFLRNKSKIKRLNTTKCRIIEGNVLEYSQPQKAWLL
jgi:saccharopine dehydrogenase-like NADP-dependent oxidoreductase